MADEGALTVREAQAQVDASIRALGGYWPPLANLARPEEALLSYDRVLKLNPRDAGAALRCGMLLIALKRPEKALVYLDLCDELLPDNATVLEQRGLALHHLALPACQLGVRSLSTSSRAAFTSSSRRTAMSCGAVLTISGSA